MRALLAFFSVCAFAAFAQSDPQAATAFRADTTLVLVPVSVTDPSNRYVLGLEKQDFHLFEDDVPQTITHFSSEDAPLSIGLLVDTSGSMGAKLDTSRRAVVEFLKTLNASDEAFLVEFSDQAELAVSLTSNSGDIENKLTSVTSGGLTAMMDAVHTGLQEMKRAKNPRKALLIISDGGDNNSRFTATQIADLVREADVQIYAMGVFEPVLSFGLSTSATDSSRNERAEVAVDNRRTDRRTRAGRKQPTGTPGDRRAHRHRASQPIRAGLFADQQEPRRQVS